MRSLDLPWSAQRTWQREPMPKISATRRPLLGMEGRIELPGAEDQCSQAMHPGQCGGPSWSLGLGEGAREPYVPISREGPIDGDDVRFSQ
jgi:hypothetical protein